MIWILLTSAFAAININTASSSELTKFNGVGPATATKIIDYREANGPFESCKQLVAVKGIGEATLAKILPECTVGEKANPKNEKRAKKEENQSSVQPSNGTSINVNTASSSELTKFNGVGPATATKIIDYREANGPFESCKQLVAVKGIGEATVSKILPNCTVGEPDKKKGKKK